MKTATFTALGIGVAPAQKRGLFHRHHAKIPRFTVLGNSVAPAGSIAPPNRGAQ